MLRRNECRLNFKNRPVRTGDLKGGPKQPPLATNRGSQEPATNQDYFTIKVCSVGKSDRRCDVTQVNPLRPSEWGFNPRTAGGLSHLRTAGGGGTYVPPRANSKTTQRIDKRKKALDRS